MFITGLLVHYPAPGGRLCCPVLGVQISETEPWMNPVPDVKSGTGFMMVKMIGFLYGYSLKLRSRECRRLTSKRSGESISGLPSSVRNLTTRRLSRTD